MIECKPDPKGMMAWVLRLRASDLDKHYIDHAVRAYFMVHTFPDLKGKEVVRWIEGKNKLEDIE